MEMTGIRLVGSYEAEGESHLAFVQGTEERRSAEEAQGLHLVGSERDKLLVEHLPTVRYIARKVHERLPQHVEMEDLVSAGTMGLIDAFNKFDHSRHVQFNSYAQFRIKGAILDHLRELDWGPRELRRKGRAIEEATQRLMHQLGRSPQEPEIAEQLGMTLSAYQQLVGDLRSLEVGSLHVVHNEASGEEEMAHLAGPEQDSPLLAVMQSEMKQLLMDTIEDLPEKERLVLTLYYYEELSMKEIGEVLGVVESRVSQIRSAGIARLRAAMGVTQGVTQASSQRRPPAGTYVGKQRLMA
jgi:RNA polymerase sigma factor for flagellar operon FliA